MASIKDVAKRAGVSISTVSLVINNSNLVKHETRYKVLQAIQELHYSPNQMARSLVTKEKKVISVVRISNSTPLSDKTDLFETSVDTLVQDMLPGIQSVLSQNGYSLLTNAYVPLNIGDSIQELDVLNQNIVDGSILVGGMITQDFISKVKEKGIPVVCAYSRHNNVDFLDINTEQGMYLSTKYLIEHGHKRIALVNGSPLSQSTSEKLKGYKRALQESSIPFSPLLVEESDFIAKSGYDAIKKICNSGQIPSGVVCGCDNVALGVYRFFYDNEIFCPKNISIIGFEAGMLSAHCVPSMTSVYTCKNEIGMEATKILLNRINNPKARPVHLIMEPRLIERDSVAPPWKSDK